MADRLTARCSWCLATTAHELKERATLGMGRDTYRCTGCKQKTLMCKKCMVPPDRRSGGGSVRLSRGASALTSGSSAGETPAEGMAKDGMIGDDYCLVCDEILGCWPSPMDEDLSLARTRSRTGSGLTGSGVLGSPVRPSPRSMRGTLSHAKSVAVAPAAERQDITSVEVEKLQLKLLDAQRSMLVRVDNKTPYRLSLIRGTETQIETDLAAGGKWRMDREPPAEILPNQALAFGTTSKGMGMGGTSARVAYEIRDPVTYHRIAAIQMRWVNPLVNGPNKNWCETRTDFEPGLEGPLITRHPPTPNDHSSVSFVIHWGRADPDHFNPDGESNPGGVLQPLTVTDVSAAARGSALQHQQTTREELPEISVWQNERRPPLMGDFTASLLVPGVDPTAWTDGNSDISFSGRDDPELLPSDCAWCDSDEWQAQKWEYATSFSTTFPRKLYSSFSNEKGLTDMVRRREWRRACVPLGRTKHKELVTQLQNSLAQASERSMVVTIHNETSFPMVLVKSKVDWGMYVKRGQPRTLIPAKAFATIAVQASNVMTGVDGSLTYSVKPATSSGAGTTVFLRYINPRIETELGVWCETKTEGSDGAPRLAINRINPSNQEHSSCTFTVIENPTAPSPNTHYNPAKGLDTGEGVASATVEGMAAAQGAGNDGLRMYLKKSPRSTMVTFTNLSSYKLILAHAEVKGGSWHKKREPPEEIAANAIVSFAASCSNNPIERVSDLKLRVVYNSAKSQGEWHGVWFDQQAGFSIRCKNPSSTSVLGSGDRTFTKYLLGDDTMGLKVAKQDSELAEQAANNEWSFLITDGEDPSTIYASRKQDLQSRLHDEERSTIVSIANRCKVPLVLLGDPAGSFEPTVGTRLHAGRWAEKPPRRINPGQTAMMALKPQIFELAGVRASLRYQLIDVAEQQRLSQSGSTQEELHAAAVSLGDVAIEFNNPSGAGSKRSYRSITNGDVFCERLVDPHDVDQRYESQTHACATFVVEQAVIQEVAIGSSKQNTKTVSIAGVLGAESVPVNPDAEGKPDAFDVRVEQSTGKIVVRRVDSQTGWHHDLKIRARMDPTSIEEEEDHEEEEGMEGGGGDSGSEPRRASSQAVGTVGTVSGFVQIGQVNWMRRGMLFSKERETEKNVEWIKEELELDKDLHTDQALKAACQRLGLRPPPQGASALKISGDCTAEILKEVRRGERTGVFLSHAQINGAPQIRALKVKLEEDCEALQGRWEDLPDDDNAKIWLDVDEKPDQTGMKNGIRRQSCFLIFLTRGYLTRRFCQYEIQWALRYEKKIVLVYETNMEYGHASFGDYMAECPVELKVIFDKSVAVPYYNDPDDVFGRLSRAEILDQCGLAPQQPNVELASRELPGAPAGRVLIVANDNDSTARAQAENLEQQLRKACPLLQLEVMDGDSYAPSSSTSPEQPEQFLIFLSESLLACIQTHRHCTPFENCLPVDALTYYTRNSFGCCCAQRSRSRLPAANRLWNPAISCQEAFERDLCGRG
jgi:hypothetical protein